MFSREIFGFLAFFDLRREIDGFERKRRAKRSFGNAWRGRKYEDDKKKLRDTR